MIEENRWAKEQYPEQYRDDINQSIGFSGLSVDFFLRGKADCIVSLLEGQNIPAAAASCLDIGCGIGTLHPLLRARVGRIAGVDVSADAIKTAKATNPGIDYQAYEGSRLPQADGSVDLSFAACVMHHVPPAQWPDFVAEAWRVTRPGGLFAVFEHNPFNPLTRLAVFRCPFDHDAVLLRMGQVKRLMQAQGFELVVQRFLFFVPAPYSWARKVDAALGWLPIGAQYVVCGRRPA